MADSRTIEIIVQVADKTQGKTKDIAKALLEMDKAAQKLNQRFKSFANLKYNATLQLIDRVTEPGNKINALLKRIAGGAHRIALQLNDAAFGKLRQFEATLMRITGKAYTIGINVKDNLKSKFGGLLSGASMATGIMAPMAGAAGIGYGVVNGLQSYMGFEKQMSRVQAIRQLDKNSAEMQQLVQQAKDLGAQTAWTRQQVGEAQYYQALAGWSTDQILASTPHILNMASAGGIDLGRASDILTDTMTAFGIKAGETYTNKQGREVSAVEHYVDMLTKMQASSNTDILQAGEAFKYSANVIGAMFSGQDIGTRMQATEDSMIATGLMANAGIKGSMAGTSLRAIFSRMTSENRNAFNALRGLGVDYKDEGGNILMPGEILRSLSKRFKEGVDPNQLLDFAEAIGGEKIHADTRRKLESFIEQTSKNGGKMGSADMAKMAAMLAGQEAMSGLLAVMMGDWDAMAEKMDNVNGTAEKMSKDMLDNLAGSFTILGSAWDAFQQSFFEGKAGDGLRGFVDTLTELVSKANELFKDGIQFGDIGKLVGDVIGRLKNKFLELDGVGSILAGGALMAGMVKIMSTAQRAIAYIKTLNGLPLGTRTGQGAGGVSAGQRVGTMTVSAGVVNVNGKVGGGVPPTGVPPTGTPPRGTPPASGRFSGMGSAGIASAAFAAIFAGLDYMSVRSSNEDRLANASASERGRILKENHEAEVMAASQGFGAILGTAIGGAFGSIIGPLGTMIGATIGGLLGSMAGDKLGQNQLEHETEKTPHGQMRRTVTEAVMSAYDETAKDFEYQRNVARQRRMHGTGYSPTKADEEADKLAYETPKVRALTDDNPVVQFRKKLGQSLDAGIDSIGDFFKNLAAVFTDPLSLLDEKKAHAAELTPEQMAQQAAMERGEVVQPTEPIQMPEIIPPETSWLDEMFNFDGIAERLSELSGQVTEGLGSIAEGAGEIFTGLSETIGSGLDAAQSAATGALETIQSAFTSAKESIQSTWAELPGFFSGIFDGLGSIAAAAGSAILSGLTSVCGAVISAWEAVSSTVSGIIASISAAVSSISLPSVGGFFGGAHAEGGFITHPEFALIGEKGPEAIIPLDGSERARELYEQTGAVLGISEETPIISASSTNGSSSGGVVVEVGGVNLEMRVEGGGDSFVQSLEEHISKAADMIAAQLSIKVEDSFRNRALSA